MTLRLKIAKWLAPEWDQEILEGDDELKSVRIERNEHMIAEGRYRRALRSIAALRTPSCAHIGKRMADIAETALREGE